MNEKYLHLDAGAFVVALVAVVQPLRVFFESLPTFPVAENKTVYHKYIPILLTNVLLDGTYSSFHIIKQTFVKISPFNIYCINV